MAETARRAKATITASRDDDSGLIRLEALDLDPSVPRWVSLELTFESAATLRDEIDRLLNLKARIVGDLVTTRT